MFDLIRKKAQSPISRLPHRLFQHQARPMQCDPKIIMNFEKVLVRSPVKRDSRHTILALGAWRAIIMRSSLQPSLTDQ